MKERSSHNSLGQEFGLDSAGQFLCFMQPKLGSLSYTQLEVGLEVPNRLRSPPSSSVLRVAASLYAVAHRSGV